jgi:fatty acid desaturase
MDLSVSTAELQPDVLAAIDRDDLVSLRTLLITETGIDYSRYRRSLSADYRKVWLDIAAGYACLILIIAITASVRGVLPGIVAALLGAIGIGYTIAYLQLFIHEAAHGNLAPGRKANDRLANALIAWQVGTRIADYRRTHSEHHRSLGEDGDTEVSYRKNLTPRFILEMIVGVHAVRVFLSRKPAPDRTAKQSSGGKAKALQGPLIGAGIHLALIGSLLAAGAWPAALAWIAGAGSIYPLLATLRQILEHRPLRIEGEGGAVTRLFGDGILSKTFGGAGFNRHFLHHLEPQISYTRLADFEAYLSGTIIGPSLAARRSSYFRTFASLLRDR